MNNHIIASVVNSVARNLGHAFSVSEKEAEGVSLLTWWAKAHLECMDACTAAHEGGYPGPSAGWSLDTLTGEVSTSTGTGRMVVTARERVIYREGSYIPDVFIRLEAWAGPAPSFGRPEPAMVASLTFDWFEEGFILTERKLVPELFIQRTDRLGLVFDQLATVPELKWAVESLDPSDDVRRIQEYFIAYGAAYKASLVDGYLPQGIVPDYPVFPIEAPEGAKVEFFREEEPVNDYGC